MVGQLDPKPFEQTLNVRKHHIKQSFCKTVDDLLHAFAKLGIRYHLLHASAVILPQRRLQLPSPDERNNARIDLVCKVDGTKYLYGHLCGRGSPVGTRKDHQNSQERDPKLVHLASLVHILEVTIIDNSFGNIIKERWVWIFSCKLAN